MSHPQRRKTDTGLRGFADRWGQTIIYVVLVCATGFLLVQAYKHDREIANQAYELCIAQRDNREVLREFIDFSLEAPRVDPATIEDPELRALLEENEHRLLELRALEEELLPAFDCKNPSFAQMEHSIVVWESEKEVAQRP